jgi:Cu-Zn family superoxide dismutase
MKLTIFLLAIGTAIAATPTPPVTADLKDATGQSVGSASFSPDDNGVKIVLDLHGIPPGVHGIHIHEAGKCEGPKFTTAGGHLNPDHKEHGKLNPNGPHAGDMDNITVGADGTAHVEIVAQGVRYSDASEPNSIFHAGGSALVIHAREDDMKTNPSGNSGDRIACGVISQ